MKYAPGRARRVWADVRSDDRCAMDGGRTAFGRVRAQKVSTADKITRDFAAADELRAPASLTREEALALVGDCAEIGAGP
jgi:hypothetical protein